MSNGAFLLPWLDQHPQGDFWLTAGLILLAFGLAAAPLLRNRTESSQSHDWGWGLLLLAILIAGRWPTFLVPRQFNVDESQLLAGAHALVHDPVFWRSVNGGTAGPLDFFTLWPAAWLCGGANYLAARLTACALLALSLTLAHQCLALRFGRSIARIASLGAVGLEALTNAQDLLHYSTELLPVALLAGAAYAAVRRWGASGGPIWNGPGGLLLGAVPLGKLQALPLAGIMGLGWLWAEIRAKEPQPGRRIARLLSGALAPAALFALQLTVAGEWRSFYNSYLLYNLNYASGGSSALGPLLAAMWQNSILWDSLLPVWGTGLLIWLALMLRPRPVPGRAARIFTWTAFAAFLISLASIVGPGRPFLHYWQLLVVPATLLLGAMTANLLATSPAHSRATERWLVVLCAGGLTGSMLFHRANHPNPAFGHLAYFQKNPRTKLAATVAAHARAGEQIAIWGWSSYLYVETGLRQATRDGHCGALVEAGPLQDYFRRRYLADLENSRPATFVDSTGPASMGQADAQYAHDRNFPELAALIRAGYVQVAEAEGARIYRRKNLVAP